MRSDRWPYLGSRNEVRSIKSNPITLTVKPHPSGASLLRSITHFDASTDGHTLVNMPNKGDQISPGRSTVKPHPSKRHLEIRLSLPPMWYVNRWPYLGVPAEQRWSNFTRQDHRQTPSISVPHRLFWFCTRFTHLTIETSILVLESLCAPRTQPGNLARLKSVTFCLNRVINPQRTNSDRYEIGLINGLTRGSWAYPSKHKTTKSPTPVSKYCTRTHTCDVHKPSQRLA